MWLTSWDKIVCCGSFWRTTHPAGTVEPLLPGVRSDPPILRERTDETKRTEKMAITAGYRACIPTSGQYRPIRSCGFCLEYFLSVQGCKFIGFAHGARVSAVEPPPRALAEAIFLVHAGPGGLGPVMA